MTEIKRYYIIIILLLSCFTALASFDDPDSWKELQKTKKGSLTLYWYTSKPFIYTDSKGKLTGIEVAIMNSFKEYLLKEHGFTLTLNWVKSDSFLGTFNTIKDSDKRNVIGVSAFSITDERKNHVKFTYSLLPDVSVIISNGNIPILKKHDDFIKLFDHLTAVTIKGTTYEESINALKVETGMGFNINYISSSNNVIEDIMDADSSFGYIDLPIYLMALQRGEKITRQNFYPRVGQGYSFIVPKHSDWDQPISNFIKSEYFQVEKEEILSKFMGKDLYKFIESVNEGSNPSLSILTKEIELQNKMLDDTSDQLAREKKLKNLLSVVLIVSFFLLLTIIRMLVKRNNAAKLLQERQERIEQQEKSIRSKNEQLENRNLRLTELNEEKNSLVKVLAHDLRTPINHINGLASIMLLNNRDASDGNDENTQLTRQIIESSQRLNQMISKILDVDALDENRVNAFFEEVNLVDTLSEITKTFEKDARKKNIDLHFDSEMTECLIQSDKLYLTQIIENLLSNAIKFSGIGKTVEVRLGQEDEDHALLLIKDQGPGFTEEDKEKLFQKYKRLSAQPTAGESSTGLGLSIVKKYVNIIKGEIWLESFYGQGASFFIRFPLTSMAPAEKI